MVLHTNKKTRNDFEKTGVEGRTKAVPYNVQYTVYMCGTVHRTKKCASEKKTYTKEKNKKDHSA